MPLPTPNASTLHGRYRQPPSPTKEAPALGCTKTTSPFLRLLSLQTVGASRSLWPVFTLSPILLSCKQMAAVC